MRKIKELEKRIKELEISQLRNNFASVIQQKMLESELHNAIANRLEVECQGDKSTLTAYMNFIYRLKTLQGDIELFLAYINAPEEIGTYTDRDTLRIRSDFSEMYLYDHTPQQIVNRLNSYNDYLYFDKLNEKSFENGYWVDIEGDYKWKDDNKSFEEKYTELIKCILNQLNRIETERIEDRFPKLVQLIERNKKVCQDKLITINMTQKEN